MGGTLDHITDPEKFHELQSQAFNNLKSWEKEKVEPPQKVEVVQQDFGVTALEVTKNMGKYILFSIWPILYFLGGTTLEGGSAQEENLWHRPR